MFELSVDKTIEEKLTILADAAKYDVACTSSGVDRAGKKGYLGNSCAAGVCHTFASDGRCVSLLKILMTNHCVFDCKYCQNRCSNDIARATFTPDEICTLTIEFYKRNYIEGLFLSSGVLQNPNHTMELINETLRLLRTKYRFNGYIHVKAIPGASEELIQSAGLLADRISINMELPTQESLARLAPNKSFNTIFKPMNQIQTGIASHRLAIGKDARMERSSINHYLPGSIFSDEALRLEDSDIGHQYFPSTRGDAALKRPFAPAGQSTQMIIGASGETDRDLVRMTQSLYQRFDLKRVFYSAYIPLNEDPLLPSKDTPVPLLREHRLYQADWLLRYYGFQAEEILTETQPNFDERVDPKCNWAVRHLDQFPVEVNTASYETLLRVPGIGPKSVKRIVDCRRYSHITFPMLKQMGVVLKRAQYFITCNGRMLYKIPIEERFIMDQLSAVEQKERFMIQESGQIAQQMNLFTDFHLVG